MVRKNSPTSKSEVKLEKYYNFFKFWFEIALKGYFDKFLT